MTKLSTKKRKSKTGKRAQKQSLDISSVTNHVGGDGNHGDKLPAAPVRNHVRSNGGANRGAHVTKLTLPNGFESTDVEIAAYYDYDHQSLNNSLKHANLKAGNSNNAKTSRREKGEVFNAKLISTAVEKSPELRVLEKGFDLQSEFAPWCCFGKKWDARRFAHGLSSNFSSPGIASGEKMIGEANFVSDWANIKDLITSNHSDTHLSYLVHRVGSVVTVDHLDLTSLILIPNFLDIPPGLRNFILNIIGDNAKKIKMQGKSNKEVLGKEAYHQLLHKAMETDIVLGTKNGKGSVTGLGSGSDDQFLHHIMASTDKHKLFVGCDVPTYVHGESSVEENVTVKASCENPIDHLDLWLDNTLMQCSKTHVTSLKDNVVTKTEWLHTDDLPRLGKFDPNGLKQYAEHVLNFIQDGVKAGYTYWLYRDPESLEMKLYNVSNITWLSEPETPKNIFETWKYLEPYVPYFTAASLIKYAELMSEAIPDKLKSDPDFSDVNMNGVVEKVLSESGENRHRSKPHKFAQRLENQVKLLDRHLREECKWVIRTVEDIQAQEFASIVACIKGVYDHATRMTPEGEAKLRKHGVERFLIMCWKLKKIIADKTEHIPIDDNFEFQLSEEFDAVRQWALNMCNGILEILSCLKVWYDQVPVEDFDPITRSEWKYFGCRLHVLYGDVLSMLSQPTLESTNESLCRRLDSDFPSSEELQKSVAVFEAALNYIPDQFDFTLKHSILLPSIQVRKDASPFKIDFSNSKTACENEVSQKLALALIRLVVFMFNFPPYLTQKLTFAGAPPPEPGPFTKELPELEPFVGLEFPEPEKPGGLTIFTPDILFNAKATRKVIKETYEEMLELLDKCIKYSSKVEQFTTGTEFEAVNPRMRAHGLKGITLERMFELDNAQQLEEFEVPSFRKSFTDADFLLPLQKVNELSNEHLGKSNCTTKNFPFKQGFSEVGESSSGIGLKNEDILVVAAKAFGEVSKDKSFDNLIDWMQKRKTRPIPTRASWGVSCVGLDFGLN